MVKKYNCCFCFVAPCKDATIEVVCDNFIYWGFKKLHYKLDSFFRIKEHCIVKTPYCIDEWCKSTVIVLFYNFLKKNNSCTNNNNVMAIICIDTTCIKLS